MESTTLLEKVFALCMIAVGPACSLAGADNAAKLPAFKGSTPGVNREIDMRLVDLSLDKKRHVVVAAGTKSVYQGHCDTVLLPDGKTMFTAWCLGHARWIGPIAKSTDAGLTWSEPLKVPGNWHKTSNTPALHRLVAPDGTARLFCFAGGLDWSRKGKPPYPMHQAYSEDDGITWTPMVPNGIEGEVPPKTIHAFDNGKRLVMWSDLPGYVVQSESLDGGLTWSASRPILRIPSRWAQPCVIRSANGKTHLMLLRENSRKYQSLFSVSHDGAKTWSAPRELPASLTGDRHVAKFAPDDRLIVAFRDVAKNSSTYGHYVAWVGRFENILEGKPGDYRIKLFHNTLRRESDKPGQGNVDCGYSDLELLQDGTIIATTYLKYAEGPEKHSVMNTRFNLAETDGLAGKKPTGQSYRHFTVTERDGRVTATVPTSPKTTPAWARNVSQRAWDWSNGPDMKKPYFEGPIPFVLPPTDEGEPFHAHNHQPAITWCPNGDLLAIWYSTGHEQGTELTVLASRLRPGADAWDPSSEFFKAPNRNMHGSSLFHDGKGTLHHFNGMAPDGGKGWAKLALLMRTSRDNGVTWTPPRAIGPRLKGRHQVITGTLMTRGGVLIQNCDAVPGGTALHLSLDGGRTWSDPGEGKPKPKFAEGGKGEWTIAGIHAQVAQLSDGRLLAFGRGDRINGRMPMSLSADVGKTWTYHASPFPPIGGGQRLVLKRLREGPLLFVSFTSGNRKKPEANGMTFTDQHGHAFTGHGMFAAVSFDDGKTWPVRRLVTPGEGKFNGGAWTGDFTATPTRAEHAGYLAATQTPDGVIHLISSRLHYRFNLAWLKSGTPSQLAQRENGAFARDLTNEMIAKTLVISDAEKQRLNKSDGLSPTESMEQKLLTERGRKLYKL